jgi:hypothetical protein
MKCIIQALEGHKIFFVKKKTIDEMDIYKYIYMQLIISVFHF